MTDPSPYGPRAPGVVALGLAVALTIVVGILTAGPGERSHLINDDASTRFVAATFASGRLVAQVPPEPSAFHPPLVIKRGGKWFGKEYPVLALLLAPALKLGCDWLVNPLLAGLLVLGTYLLAQSLQGPRVGIAAASLVTLSPSFLVLATSYLNTVLSAVLLVFTAFAWITADRRASTRGAMLGGFLFGAALATKPFTAALMLVPLGAIPFARWFTDRQAALRLVTRLALGAAPWLVAMVAWNVMLTGDPLRTPYQLFQPWNRPGFGPEMVIDGVLYTPTVALADSKQQIIEFADTLMPVPWVGRAAILLALLTGWIALRRSAIPLILTGVVLVAGHFFFYGFRSGSWGLLGCRYLFEATPAIAVLLASALTLATRRLRPDAQLVPWLAITLAAAAFGTVPRAEAFVRWRHQDPFSGPNRRLERFLRGLDRAERRVLFVDISTYNAGSAVLTNRPDLSGQNVVAVYREPAQNRAVLDALPGRSASLVRWSRETSGFTMEPYRPENDVTGPPQAFPYDQMRKRGVLRKDGGADTAGA